MGWAIFDGSQGARLVLYPPDKRCAGDAGRPAPDNWGINSSGLSCKELSHQPRYQFWREIHFSKIHFRIWGMSGLFYPINWQYIMTNILEFNSYQSIPVALTGLLLHIFYNLIPDNFSSCTLWLNEFKPACLSIFKFNQNYQKYCLLKWDGQRQFLQTKNLTVWHIITKLKGDKDFFVKFFTVC